MTAYAGQRFLVLKVLATVAIVVVSVIATDHREAARAAFPGANGKIAFTSYRDGDGEIYVMDADGTEQIRLTQNAAMDSEPDWSPDGRRMVFRSRRVGIDEIYVMNADGTAQANLSENPAIDIHPGLVA